MAERTPIVVIGAGVGGLAAAIRLAAVGHRVVVLERHANVGGKLAARRHDSFVFDVGPSLLVLPAGLRRAAGDGRDDAGRRARRGPPRSAVPLPLARWCRARRARRRRGDGGDVRALRARRRRGVATLRCARQADLGDQRPNVLRRADGRPWQLLRRMRSPADLVGIDPLRTLHRCAADHFADPRLVQWAGRYATYSGSSPFRAPATLACIPHVESRFGCWYPRGGLDALRAALLGVASSPRRRDPRGHRRGADHLGRRCRHRGRARRWQHGWPPGWSSPTPTPSTSTVTCCPTIGRCGACGAPSHRRAGSC